MVKEKTGQPVIEAHPHTIMCSHCALPSIEIRNGLLVIHNRHHGQTHKNYFSIEWLQEEVERLKKQVLPDNDTL